MKLLIDFFPVLLFFLAFKFFDMYVATAVAIVATAIQIILTWLRTKKVPPMQWVTLGVILVLGGLTLYLRDEQFIKWKPTVINWLFGAVFLGTQVFGRRTAIEHMLGASITLPQTIWKRLNLGWAVFFVLLGAANLVVMTYCDSNTWVNFKLFGMLGLTLLFVVLQSLYLSRYMEEPQKEQ